MTRRGTRVGFNESDACENWDKAIAVVRVPAMVQG